MLDKIRQKYDKRPIKADVNVLPQLKTAMDDVILEYLTKVRNLVQSTLLTDLQIVVGVISTILACAVAYSSVTYEFKDYRTLLAISLCVYCVLNAIMYLITKIWSYTFKFGDMAVYTSINPPSDIYSILIHTKGRLIPQKYSRSVFDLFDSEGTFLHNVFLDDIDALFDEKK